jgi:hypothetical protein
MMIEHLHQLTLLDAKARINRLFELLPQNRHGVVTELNFYWDSQSPIMRFAFKINGFPIDGEIQLTPGLVRAKFEFPLALRLFQKTIENFLREKLAEVFSQANSAP